MMRKNKISTYFNDLDKQYYFIILGMIYATIFFSCYVVGYKIVSIKGYYFCASVFIFPLLFPINDSITEIFGVKVTYLMIILTIFCEFLFSFSTYLLALLPSPANWPNQEMYPTLTSGFTHIAFADAISLPISFFFNGYFLNKWGIKLSGRGFFLRSLGATAVGELVFTVLINVITYNSFHVAGAIDTFNIIVSDYFFKMGYSIIVCIPNAILVNKIKKNLGAKSAESLQLSKNIIDFNSLKPRYRV